VGIGTTTPGSSLTVISASNPIAKFYKGVTNSVLGEEQLIQIGDTGDAYGVQIGVVNTVLNPNPHKHAMIIKTATSVGNYTEKFRLTADGNVGIGTSAPTYKLDVNGDFNSSGDIRMKGAGVFSYIAPTGPFYIGGGVAGRITICNGMSNSCDTGITVKDSGGINTVGIGTTSPSQTLTVNGNAGNTTGVWVNNSDQRLKKNIEPLTPFLDRLLSLRPVTFEWKDPKKLGASDGKHIGFIAQEVEKVLPNWVDTDREGFKWLNMEGANAVFVKALQELVEKDRARDKRLGELEEENKELKSTLSRSESDRISDKQRISNLEAKLEKMMLVMEKQSLGTYAKK
jgi:hypothetical protein